jgi:hypothetical protein
MTSSPQDLAARLEKAIAYWRITPFQHQGVTSLVGEHAETILAALRSSASAREVETIERCAKVVEGLSWILPMLDDEELNDATDDAAEEVLSQAARAIRALAPPPSPSALAEP